MRVFFLYSVDFDITNACRFGSLVAVYDDRSRPSVFDHSRFQQDLITRMEVLQFDPDNDWLLCAGAQVPLLLATAFMLNRYRKVKTLLFHAKEQRYVERILEINDASK